jgi:hypothetical protein
MVPLLTILRVFAVVLALVFLASIGAALAVPELGIESYEGARVWKGVMNSKNALGFWAAVGVLLYLTLFSSTHTAFFKLCCVLFAGVSFAVLIMSHSATSLLALLLSLSVCLYIYIAIRFSLGFFRMVILAVLFGGLVLLLASNIETAELVGRTDDLTGRGEVWQQTWKLIMKKPLTGYGYGALWFPTDATIWVQQSLTDFTWVVFHAHNGLLQVASEIGLPLACIALLMVAQQLIEIFYCQYEKQQVGVLFVLGFVLAYLVSNYSEARFLVNRELYWIFFLALPISMLRQINVVSDVEDTITGLGPRGATQGVPGKPWLDDSHLGATGSGLAAHDLPQLQHVTIDHADIDLGGSDDSDSADVSPYDPGLSGGTLDYSSDNADISDYDVYESSDDIDIIDEYDDLHEEDDRYEKRISDDLDDDVDKPEK